jgi:hypothetical protein
VHACRGCAWVCVAVEPGFARSGVCVRGCVAALRTCVRGLPAASWARGPSWAREKARQSAARLYLVSATKKTGIGEARWSESRKVKKAAEEEGRRRRTHSPAISSVCHLPSHCVVVGVFVFVRARPRSVARTVLTCGRGGEQSVRCDPSSARERLGDQRRKTKLMKGEEERRSKVGCE